MTKIQFQPPIRLRKGADNIFLWPSDAPVPQLDENLRSSFVFRTVGAEGEEFVRSISGLVIRQDGEDILCFGTRTMSVGSLQSRISSFFVGRVSLDNKGYRGQTSLLKVRLPDDRIATLDVLKC